MRRVIWLAIGAAGGILVYRRSQQFAASAREQGLASSAQDLGRSAVSTAQAGMSAVASARALLDQLGAAQRSASTTTMEGRQ